MAALDTWTLRSWARAQTSPLPRHNESETLSPGAHRCQSCVLWCVWCGAFVESGPVGPIGSWSAPYVDARSRLRRARYGAALNEQFGRAQHGFELAKRGRAPWSFDLPIGAVRVPPGDQLRVIEERCLVAKATRPGHVRSLLLPSPESSLADVEDTRGLSRAHRNRMLGGCGQCWCGLLH